MNIALRYMKGFPWGIWRGNPIKKEGKDLLQRACLQKGNRKWQEKDHLQRVFSEKTEIVHCPSSNGADNGIYL